MQKLNFILINKMLGQLKPKRLVYLAKFCHLEFKRRFKRFFRLLAAYILTVLSISLLVIIFIILIITIKIKQNPPKQNYTENIYFQPLIRDFEFNDPSPHWNDHVQFDVPNVEGVQKDWHDYAAMAADRKRVGPGEHGEPVSNRDILKKYIEDHISLEHGFNALVSDLISINRSVPDIRITTCHTKRYLAKLPTVSIVIACRNEYNSVLQRTLHSIVNRTPQKLIKEIIIVDDNSFRGYSVDDMSEYADHHFPNLVKFVRLYERKGMIYARIAGAKLATGEVLIFFDSHIECNYNWLPPLLEPIAINDRICTSPRIDIIANDNFAYKSNSDSYGHRGGFNWDLSYIYLPLRLGVGVDPTKPYKDPVMMGGLFAISRRFFWDLGGYDIGIDIWGAEQFELSFKIWMCGGMLLVIPCSHVGHIFRGPTNSKAELKNYKNLKVNNKRVAEVWMDEYKKYVYETNPDVYYKLDAGNLTEQHAVRKRLKCKSFKWYLEFVAPDILDFNPIEPLSDYASGAIQSVAYPQLCLDSMNRHEGMMVGIFHCGPNRIRPHTNQFWNFNVRQEVKNHWRNLCLDVYEASANAEVAMLNCHHQGGNQFWHYDVDRKWLIHGSNGNNCLELMEDDDEAKIVVNVCSVTNVRMRWLFGFVNESLTPSKYELE